MRFVDDKVMEGELQRFVAAPVIVFPDDLAPVRKRVGRIRLPSPYASSRDRFGVRIQKNPGFVIEQAVPGIIGAVKAIAVLRVFNIQVENHDGKYISDAEFLRKRNLNKGFMLPAVKEKQRAGCRLL